MTDEHVYMLIAPMDSSFVDGQIIKALVKKEKFAQDYFFVRVESMDLLLEMEKLKNNRTEEGE